MTRYFVANEEGKVLDKDGYDPKKPEDIELFEFNSYAYGSEENAEGYVDWFDPEGRAGLQVISREVVFRVEPD